jgi:hypothetical protein
MYGGQMGFPETAVRNYQYTLRNCPEECISHLLRVGRLKSRNSGMLHRAGVTLQAHTPMLIVVTEGGQLSWRRLKWRTINVSYIRTARSANGVILCTVKRKGWNGSGSGRPQGDIPDIRLRTLTTRQSMYVNRNNEGRSYNCCCRGKAITITHPECVFVALNIQQAKRLSVSTKFFHIIS